MVSCDLNLDELDNTTWTSSNGSSYKFWIARAGDPLSYSVTINAKDSKTGKEVKDGGTCTSSGNNLTFTPSSGYSYPSYKGTISGSTLTVSNDRLNGSIVFTKK